MQKTTSYIHFLSDRTPAVKATFDVYFSKLKKDIESNGAIINIELNPTDVDHPEHGACVAIRITHEKNEMAM